MGSIRYAHRAAVEIPASGIGVSAIRLRSRAHYYCTPRRAQSVPRPAYRGAMLTLPRLPC